MSATQETNVSVPSGLRVGFIGFGRMGYAMANGFLKAGLVSAGNMTASDPGQPNIERITAMGGTGTKDNSDVVPACDILLLCVKPQVLSDALEQVAPLVTDKHLIISVVSGADIKRLTTLLGGKGRIIRMMPNLPCLVGCGATAFCPGPTATRDDCALTSTLFSSLGICEKVPERLLDAVTGLSGCGPAFVFQVIEALADGGVLMGLPRTMAQQFAVQTVKGAALMVEQTGKHPAELKDEICSPGGTTIAGVHQLEKTGLRAALMNAVQAGANRSTELGNLQKMP